MSKKKYLKLSKIHYLDLDSFRVVTEAEKKNPCIIQRPIYWGSPEEKKAVGFEMQNGQLVNVYTQEEPTNVITLRGIRLVCIDNYSFSLCFYDNRKKTRHDIVVNGNNIPRVGLGYNISFDGASASFSIPYILNGFSGKGLVNLATKNYINKFYFSYGLNMRKYQVKYKDRLLDGDCYIFIYCGIGIILQDNLSFDALFIIKSWTPRVIEVSQFIYTSNLYLIKMIALK